MQVRPFVSVSWPAELEPAVVPPPAGTLPQAVDKAVVLNTPTMVDGRPVGLTETVVDAPASRDRIVVGSVDVTYFRGKRTPTPTYTLTEPFAYGSANLTFPQVSPVLESGSLDVGELAWTKKGSVVKLQRVAADGTVKTDYRGRVIARRLTSAGLLLEVGGILSGPASLLNRQVPVYRSVSDVATLAANAIDSRTSGGIQGVPFTSSGLTGIEIAGTGGMTYLGWLQHLCSMAVARNGDQWTIMPTTWGGGTFTMRLKDSTTKHCTIYLDRDRAVPELVDDAAEQWNTGFGTCVTSDGMIVNGMVLPGVEQADPPPFPGTLSLGDSGDDVLTLSWKLVRAGLLDRDVPLTTFDAETEEAVEDLQDMAGLPQTGAVNEATWNALFDVGVTGFSLAGARIMPIVQAPKVREWNYTANGSLAGRNPSFDPNALRVDRDIDFGSGLTEKGMRRWMRGHRARIGDMTWTGTITLNGCAVIAGEHNPGDPAPPAADVIPARDIQPGWNVWLPGLAGGTLVHVAQVDVDPGDYDTVTLTVDTAYRDALELGEIIARNKDSRRNPRREWAHEQRGSTRIHDAVTPFNQKAGQITANVSLAADTWNEVPVFAGQAGTVSKLRLALTTYCEFSVVAAAKKIGEAKMNRRVGNPFPVDADGETVWTSGVLDDFFADRLVVYAAGADDQPCGYWPKKHINAAGNTTSAPLTGVWQDDAGFGYFTFAQPVLWLYIYPKAATSLQRGRVLWAQLEPGV